MGNSTKQQNRSWISKVKVPLFFKDGRSGLILELLILILAIGSIVLFWLMQFPWFAFVLLFFVLIIALIKLIQRGYTKDWTGFGDYRSKYQDPKRDYQRSKTLWDWLQLLIIPLVLASGAIWFNAQQSNTSTQISIDQQQETLLETYFDRMSDLLITNKLATSKPGDETRIVARVRTLATLSRLDPGRKSSVLLFLSESNLINKNRPVVDIHGADLRYTNSPEASLSETVLSGVNLSGAYLDHANLQGTLLVNADLRNAYLFNADLSGADLSRADLRGAMISGDQFAKTKSLYKTIMPDGSIHL